MSTYLYQFRGPNSQLSGPSPEMIREAASELGCTVPALKAVIAVEAAGKWYTRNGEQIRRFEPHKLPAHLKRAIGWTGGWRDSLRLSTANRRSLFAKVHDMDAEAANRAASWGAFQIMGFNHRHAGFPSATAMVEAFATDITYQLEAFVKLIRSFGIDGALRAHDWYTFASAYNGTGKAADYARKIERAYVRYAGTGSSEVLRMGSSGYSVRELQTALRDRGFDVGVDGQFGPQTMLAVKDYQAAQGLPVDGIVGHRTWSALKKQAVYKPEPEPEETSTDKMLDRAKAISTIAAGGSGTAGVLLDGAGDEVRIALIGAVVLFVGMVLWLNAKKTANRESRT